MPDYVAIILAAGRGERSGREDGPKQYRMLAGRTVISRALDVFRNDPDCQSIMVVRHADDETLFYQSLGDAAAGIVIVVGGATRQQSALNALEQLATLPNAQQPQFVMIHDSARPFLDNTVLQRVKSAMNGSNGAIPALPIADTIKRADPSMVISETVSRANLHGAQTPQGFPFSAILAAHRAAALQQDIEFTDDSSIAEWAGLAVRLVEGSQDNIKLTWKRDIEMAEERLTRGAFPDVRTGNGYDVHSFVPGDHVWLGGVKISHSHGLNGHSDSDVALHALTDALLATCAAGDIGTHFPPSDPQWKGCASSVFVRHAADLLRNKGGRIANVDITLICEAPRIGTHREAMTNAISAMLEINPDRVSIKATTNEKLGFIGRSEGIAAIATASVIYPGSIAIVSR